MIKVIKFADGQYGVT